MDPVFPTIRQAPPGSGLVSTGAAPRLNRSVWPILPRGNAAVAC
jgi:hypothetical protein